MTKQCSTENCRKKAQKNRSICRSCRTIREREKDPVRYSYMVHQKNARRRGIPFELPLDYYRDHVVSTGYLAKKGRRKDSWHIDRINEALGYVVGNIQNLTNSENVRKSLQYRYNGRQMEFKMLTTVDRPIEGCPF